MKLIEELRSGIPVHLQKELEVLDKGYILTAYELFILENESC